jgi:hypothetical protein
MPAVIIPARVAIGPYLTVTNHRTKGPLYNLPVYPGIVNIVLQLILQEGIDRIEGE